jgi:prepilin-type N-terminal cleavage/methylation domain-containing protein
VRRTEGVTIIELLVALAILGILLSLIVQPITSIFQITTNSNRQLAGTAQAQRIVERFKGIGNTAFDRNCVPLVSPETGQTDLIPATVTATVQYLNPNATPTAASAVNLVASSTCGSLAAATTATTQLKRLTILVVQGSQTSARIVVDVPRSVNP